MKQDKPCHIYRIVEAPDIVVQCEASTIDDVLLPNTMQVFHQFDKNEGLIEVPLKSLGVIMVTQIFAALEFLMRKDRGIIPPDTPWPLSINPMD
jgi:hypothetical protein